MELLLLRRKNIIAMWWFWLLVALALAFMLMCGPHIANALECLSGAKEVRAKFPGAWPSWRGHHCWFASAKTHRGHTHPARGTVSHRDHRLPEKDWTDTSHIITWMMVTAGKAARLREDRNALNARIQEWTYIQSTYKPFCGPAPDWKSCPIPSRQVQSVPKSGQDSVAGVQGSHNARIGQLGRSAGASRPAWDAAAYFR